MKKLIIIILTMVVVCSAQLSPDKQKLYDENSISPGGAAFMSMVLPTSGYFYSKTNNGGKAILYGLIRGAGAYLAVKSIRDLSDKPKPNGVAYALAEGATRFYAGLGIGIYFLFGVFEAADVADKAKESNKVLYNNLEKNGKVSFDVAPYKDGAKLSMTIPLQKTAQKKLTKEMIAYRKKKKDKLYKELVYKEESKNVISGMLCATIFPSLGYAYAGDWNKGLIPAGIGVLAGTSCFIAANNIRSSKTSDFMEKAGFACLFAARVYEFVDVTSMVSAHNNKLRNDIYNNKYKSTLGLDMLLKKDGIGARLAYNF